MKCGGTLDRLPEADRDVVEGPVSPRLCGAVANIAQYHRRAEFWTPRNHVLRLGIEQHQAVLGFAPQGDEARSEPVLPIICLDLVGICRQSPAIKEMFEQMRSAAVIPSPK